jgi:transposase-like protein
MDCPKCKKGDYCKDGVIKNRQRYRCKNCNYRYTVTHRAGTGDEHIKRQALELYLEGLGFRAISRLLKFSNVTILNWIRSFGEQISTIKSQEPVKVMELDEMHSYIGQKKLLLDMDCC